MKLLSEVNTDTLQKSEMFEPIIEELHSCVRNPFTAGIKISNQL